MATASLTVPAKYKFSIPSSFQTIVIILNKACISPQVVCKAVKIDKSGAMNSPEYAATQDNTHDTGIN